MKIKYSFIVPVYGCEKYLESCVESILTQKGDHVFEVILVDDGSKDRSGQIADELAARDSRVRTFHKENGGAASARNAGIREARGEYILFIDGDDTVEDRLLDHVDKVLSVDPEALVIFGMAFDFYRNEKLNRTENLSCKHEGHYSVKQILDTYIVFFRDNSLSSVCNKVFSLKKIQQNQLLFDPQLVLYEDLIFTVSYLQHIESAVCIPVCFYHYRICEARNQYAKRISNLESVNYMLSEMRRTMCYIDSKDSLEIRCGVLHQIVMETLLGCCFKGRMFEDKVVAFNRCPEFIYIYSEISNEEREQPAVFALIKSKRYVILWFWLVLKKLRHRLAGFIKCGEYYVLFLKKHFLENK